MVRERDPFGLALRHLGGCLRDGLIEPGRPVLAAELATELQISATPVREALSRLAGEGLLEDRRGRGFYVLHPAAAQIEELYGLHGAYVEFALAADSTAAIKMPSSSEALTSDAQALRGRAEQLFSLILQRTDGGVARRAHQRVADQLAPIRLLEPLAIGDAAEELKGLWFAAMQSMADFRAAHQAYHAKRCAAARVLAGLLLK